MIEFYKTTTHKAKAGVSQQNSTLTTTVVIERIVQQKENTKRANRLRTSG